MVTIIDGETYEEFRERTEKEFPIEMKVLGETLEKLKNKEEENRREEVNEQEH